MHIPVLADRVAELLSPALAGPAAVCVDATVGLAGHARLLLAQHEQLRLVGLDRDPEALALAATELERFEGRATLVHAVYDRIAGVLSELGIERVDAVLFDLGVSSLQLDEPRRGFSFRQDGPLDMRMDPASPRTAADVVNNYSAAELARVLSRYGEERFAGRIAEAIVRERAQELFSSTARLAEVVREAIPAATRRTGGHPARRTFQALRIEVNGELEALERALPAGVDVLRVGGRIAVLSYHSLEDRLVKRVFAAGARPDVPPGLPEVPADRRPSLRLLTRGAERPSEAEQASNPRATSARLRAAERTREAA